MKVSLQLNNLPGVNFMAVSEDLLTIRDVVDAMAQAQPEIAFLISPETGHSVPFQKLRERSILLYNALHDMGLERGDKVAFLMDSCLFACCALGQDERTA